MCGFNQWNWYQNPESSINYSVSELKDNSIKLHSSWLDNAALIDFIHYGIWSNWWMPVIKLASYPPVEIGLVSQNAAYHGHTHIQSNIILQLNVEVWPNLFLPIWIALTFEEVHIWIRASCLTQNKAFNLSLSQLWRNLGSDLNFIAWSNTFRVLFSKSESKCCIHLYVSKSLHLHMQTAFCMCKMYKMIVVGGKFFFNLALCRILWLNLYRRQITPHQPPRISQSSENWIR